MLEQEQQDLVVTERQPLAQTATWKGDVDPDGGHLVDNVDHPFRPERITVDYRRTGSAPWSWVATVSGPALDGIGAGRIDRYLSATSAQPDAPAWIVRAAQDHGPQGVERSRASALSAAIANLPCACTDDDTCQAHHVLDEAEPSAVPVQRGPRVSPTVIVGGKGRPHP